MTPSDVAWIMVALVLAAWLGGPLVGEIVRRLQARRPQPPQLLAPKALAALEAEAFEEVYPEKTRDLIARLDRELGDPPRPLQVVGGTAVVGELRCPDCGWTEIRTRSGRNVRAVRAYPCERHDDRRHEGAL